MYEIMTDCKFCGTKNIPVFEDNNSRGYGYYARCPKCGRLNVIDEIDLTKEYPREHEYETARDFKETRCYYLRGSKKNLDTIERFLRHAEYLGSIGASRNLLLRIDGDGFGQIKIFDKNMQSIDRDKYNTKQDLGQGALVGIYDLD